MTPRGRENCQDPARCLGLNTICGDRYKFIDCSGLATFYCREHVLSGVLVQLRIFSSGFGWKAAPPTRSIPASSVLSKGYVVHLLNHISHGIRGCKPSTK